MYSLITLSVPTQTDPELLACVSRLRIEKFILVQVYSLENENIFLIFHKIWCVHEYALICRRVNLHINTSVQRAMLPLYFGTSLIELSLKMTKIFMLVEVNSLEN